MLVNESFEPPKAAQLVVQTCLGSPTNGPSGQKPLNFQRGKVYEEAHDVFICQSYVVAKTGTVFRGHNDIVCTYRMFCDSQIVY